MTQNLRQIKLRIKSIESTRRITRAMEMVSAAKLNRVKGAFYAARAYSASLETMIKRLAADTGGLRHPLVDRRRASGTVALCVIASDTGLCGNYNHSILKAADRFLADSNPPAVRLIAVGREAFKHYKGRGYFVNTYVGLHGRYSAGVADEITDDLVSIFTRADADEVHIAYMRFSPSLRHTPVVEKLLNIECAPGVCPVPKDMSYSLEPDAGTLIDRMAPAYITGKMRSVLLEAFTAEHSARMLAMKTANDNASGVMDKLTLLRNKARQYAITREVLEIASSAEALRG